MRRTPLWRLLAVAAAGSALIPATGPVRDVDAYWHVRLGDLILRTRALPDSEPWNFASLGRPWVPHSWLSDVLLALAHRAGGWGGIAALRLLCGAALFALLARAVIRDTDAIVGPVVFAVSALVLARFVLDRPQLFALVLAAALLPWAARLRAGAVPHPLAVAALAWLWASLHGSWPLVPGVLLVAVAGALLERRRASFAQVRVLLLGVVAAFAGAAVTPAGPGLLARPLVIAREAQPLHEWQPTVLWSPGPAPFALLLAAVAVGWALTQRPPAGEVVWCLAFAAFGLMAGRNIAFATIAIAPVVAARLSAAVPAGRRSTVPAWSLPALGAVFALLLVTLTAGTPRLPADAPRALVATLRAQPGDRLRVLNDLSVGGYLTGVGDPRVSAAIDGRIDAFPRGYLARYRRAMRLEGDWQRLLDDLRPTHALLDRTTPMAHVLVHERGWRTLGTDRVFVLLAAP